MKTVRSLLHGEIIRAVSFVLIGFLALFLFSTWSTNCRT
jgi:lipid-A-disaccharide synthase-like uncharacterized protein